MDVNVGEPRQRLLRFQSNFVLPVARVAFIVGAALSIVAIVVGLATALYFQVKTLEEPEHVVVPEIANIPLPPISIAQLDARMQPPHDLRITVTIPLIVKTLTENDVLGVFDATATNGLAKYPDDFSVLGGDSADLFRRVPRSGGLSRSALVPTEKLIEKISSVQETLQPGERRTENYSLKVVARDIYGGYSSSAEIDFRLILGPLSDGSKGQSNQMPYLVPDAQANKHQKTTPLQDLAREIALKLDPQKTIAFADYYKRALEIPAFCGADQGLSAFMVEYRRAFDHVQEKLGTTNVEAFYNGLCDTWKTALSEQRQALAEAEAARNDAVQLNSSMDTKYDIMRIAGWAGRKVALSVVIAAFGLFLVIALSLAVLASENHSKVVRDLTEAARIFEASSRYQGSRATEMDDSEAVSK